MGGDHAPSAPSQALLSIARKRSDINFLAVGLPEVLSQYFAARPKNVTICPVESAISMSMSVSEATKLGSSSSIGYAINLLKQKECHCVISAGSTAALMSIGYLNLKMQPGVRRPTILSSVIYRGNKTIITDLGANIVCKPEDLLSNARIAVKTHGGEKPSVALLNVATEANKGTPLIQKASQLLQDSELNYKGFVEGYDLIDSSCDIIICDGFVGNCVTKLLESLITLLSKNGVDICALPRVHNAALLAGLNGSVYKVHGCADSWHMEQALIDVISEQEAIIA